MGLMNQDMYLTGDGGWGQGANAFMTNLFGGTTNLAELEMKRKQQAIQEQLIQQQIGKLQREQMAGQQIADLFAPKEGQPNEAGTAKVREIMPGLMANAPDSSTVEDIRKQAMGQLWNENKDTYFAPKVDLQRALPILAQADADKAVQLGVSMQNLKEKTETQKVIEELKNDYRFKFLETKNDWEREKLKEKFQMDMELLKLKLENASNNKGDTLDRQFTLQTLRDMPKQQREMATTQNNIKSIDKALGLLATGNVSGKGGQLRSFLAPYAEMFGMQTDAMTDAQTYELLTRTIVGPMRLDIIGPGPVSEWEQKLMQKMSGSGGASQEAAEELLGFYRKQAVKKIETYNDMVNGIVSSYPKAANIYKPIDIENISKEQGDKSGGGNVGRTTADRFNNPWGITKGNATVGIGKPSGVINKEGSEWMTYASLEEGEQAARSLWKKPLYQNKTVDSALRTWSNNGYNGSIVPELKNKMVRDLTPSEFDTVINTQRRYETGGTSQGIESKLVGKKPGRYRINGKEVTWDGKRVY